jgi:beta-glucanase (GH16 family)
MEWYDPSVPNTHDGYLDITMTEQPIHGLNFMSGMLQTWNKLCFNGGAYFEVSMSMPGNPRASGYWPGAWTMGNLGRAGFGATNDGMWRESRLLTDCIACVMKAIES